MGGHRVGAPLAGDGKGSLDLLEGIIVPQVDCVVPRAAVYECGRCRGLDIEHVGAGAAVHGHTAQVAVSDRGRADRAIAVAAKV